MPTKSANLPFMSIVTSDSHCTSNDDTNPILPSLPLEAHKHVLSSNATAFKNTVKTKKHMPPKSSFILITETWCSQAVSDLELNIQNYRLYRCDRETKREGGCIIYALDTLTTNKVEDSVMNSLPEPVWISVNTLNHSLLLGCIYRAPDSSDNGNDLIINAFVHASSLNFSAKVITGDFNYPGIKLSTGNCQSCNDEFSATINMHCWSQWVRAPTRGDSILDLIFSRDVIPLSVKVYDEFESSDHKIVVCALPIYPSYNRSIQKTCQYRDYEHADWDLLHSLVKLSDWGNFFSCNSLIDAIDEFYVIINSCLDSCVPLKTYRFSKPYELYIPARYRNKLKRLQNRYFKSNDFTAAAQITIFNQIKEEHRSKAINEELLELNTNSKVQNITLLFNKHTKATRNVDIPCIQHNSTFIYDSKTMADLFSSILEWCSNHMWLCFKSYARD
ncbi:unnamed protein product [Schistosoma mattheei]|uniref:Uncharacterized protein n=1 Tax=Schistosoma mattheei TaxID=31246 RepID=A0A183NMD9_9TREM|nr:unnamed protein product [Schistosoma mattheei]